MNLLKLLTLLAALGPKIPKAIELITALVALFKPEIDALLPAGGGGLENVQLSAEEQSKVDEITACLSADGTLAAFDLGSIISLVKLAAQVPGLWDAIRTLLELARQK